VLIPRWCLCPVVYGRETNAKCSNKIESIIPIIFSCFHPFLETLTVSNIGEHWHYDTTHYTHHGDFLSVSINVKVPRDSWLPQLVDCFFVCCKCLSHVAAELNTTITIKLHGEAPASKRTAGGYLWGAGRSLYFGFEIPLLWGWETSWHRWRRREHGWPWLLIVWCKSGWPTLWHL
jgi:hypothetical protein